MDGWQLINETIYKVQNNKVKNEAQLIRKNHAKNVYFIVHVVIDSRILVEIFMFRLTVKLTPIDAISILHH